MSKKIIKFTTILFFLSLISCSSASALTFPWQNKNKEINQALSPDLSEMLERKKIFEDFLKQEGIEWEDNFIDLAEGEKEKVVEKAQEIFGSNIRPNYMSFSSENDQEYSLSTGLSGNVAGNVLIGVYEIGVSEIKDVDIILAEKIAIKSSTGNRLFIGLKKGSGRVIRKEYKPQQCWISFSPFCKEKTGGEEIITRSKLEPLEADDLIVQLYHDRNGNGFWDQGEEPVKWAGVKIDLNLVGTRKKLKLDSGISKLVFDQDPANIEDAFDLFFSLEKAGGGPGWIKVLDGYQQVYAIDTSGIYGQPFRIEANRNYQIKLDKAIELSIAYDQ
jgi:hypothetical protein